MSKHSVIGAVTLGLAIVTSVPAFADLLADCRRAAHSTQFIRACDQIIENRTANAENRSLAYRYRGDARITAGATADAIMDYSEAILLQPNNMLALAGRGRARLLTRDLDRAVEDYTAALRLAPSAAWLLIERGHVNLVRNDSKAAIADLTAALAIEPRNSRALNNRGLAHRRAGNLDAAYSDYSAAIEINPVYAVAYANRGYFEAGRGRKEQAISDLQTALLLDPSLSAATAALKSLGVTSTSGKETTERVAAGKALVETYCRGCHAVGQTGDSPNPRAPEFRTLHQRHPLLALREPLTRGIAAPHEQMPRFDLSERQIDSIVAYINSLTPAGKSE